MNTKVKNYKNSRNYFEKNKTMTSDSCKRRMPKKSRKTFTESVDHFSEETTFHGMRNAFHSKYKIPRRLFWILVISVMTGIYIYLLVNSTLKYFRYESTTAVMKVRTKSLNFPAVSICDQMIFPKSTLDLYHPRAVELVLKLFTVGTTNNLTASGFKL